ncbi:hypothetical protein BH20ACT21_BH20ACT21_19730 [soil metagenome]|nr:hypothetical protein [Actinomycetota bacterium]
MSIERVHYCGLYIPGHDVHWIQAKLGSKDKTNLPAPGHLVEVRPDGLVIVEIEDDVRRLWNHDPERLKRLVTRNSGEISHQPRWGLMSTPSDGGAYQFCVADADRPDLRPCPAHPPTGDPADLLREAGGFSIPGPEALSWMESS